MQGRVAVIMSLYKSDVLAFVREAVESVLNQSYRSFDLYIQCDGDVQSDVKAFLSGIKDERVFVYQREQNKGLAYSLNELLAIVLPLGYEYIARMDADDISMPTRFEKQVEFLDNRPEVDCVGTWAIEIKADGSDFFQKQMPETHEGCWRQFMKRDCMIHPTVMFRQSYFEKAGRYSLDTYFGEDTMRWAQGFSHGCVFANLPVYLFRFRLNEEFFNRRRGWKHAKGILSLRWKVNRMLHYPIKAYLYAIAYAMVKMMPKGVLSLMYKTLR